MGIIDYLRNPSRSFFILKRMGLLERMSDERYLKFMYKAHIGNVLHLDNPITFNEKLQWIKLYDRKPEYTTMVDKLHAKEYVASIIGNEYIVPTYGVYSSFDEIDFSKLPNKFVIKCTHDSGGLVICQDKSKFDIARAKSTIEASLKRDFYSYGREWVYKNVIPQIIVEKYIESAHEYGLVDYKFYCFNGIVEFLYVSMGLDNHETASMSFYDLDMKKLPFYRSDFKEINYDIEKPKNFDKMIEISTLLSKDIPFLRVDLYNINGMILFSELTFYPNAGFMPFEPKEWDEKLGELLKLPIL